MATSVDPAPESLSEAIEGLRQNRLFRVYTGHMIARRDARIIAAIKADAGVDKLRGRAAEMMELVQELEE